MKKFAQAALTAILLLLVALIFLAVFSAKASAQTMATAPNTSGGEIRLASNDCPRAELKDQKKRMLAYIRTSDNEIIVGCWRTVDGQAHVDYETIGVRLYPFSGFTLTKYGKEVLQAMDDLKLQERKQIDINKSRQQGITGSMSTL